MKKLILIIIPIILISLFIYSEEENPEIENLYNFSNEDTTLLWYKNIEFTLGYNLGFCCRGAQLNNSPSTFSLEIHKLILGVAYWFDAIESGFRFPINNRVFEIGIGYGWANIGTTTGIIEHFKDTLINNILINWGNRGIIRFNKVSIYSGYIVAPYMICGLELNYSRGYGGEVYYPYVYPNSIINDIRIDFIGGGIYFKLCNTKKNFKKIRFDPYLMFKIAGCSEIRSSSPYSELWDKKLTIWYTGLYIGFNINR